jgi:stage V sporulation protein G
MKEAQMEITEVRVKLVEKSGERLRAFCSITLDGAFVIRDLKVIGGTGGAFVAMPSRKLADRCPRCRTKNHLRARFCNECGQKLNDNRAPKDRQGRAKLHADIAHPINTACREMIQEAVIKAYEQELERSKSPDYRPPAYDELEEAFIDEPEVVDFEKKAEAAPSASTGVEDDAEENLEAEISESEDSFSDYNSLIAELREEAAGRDEQRREGRPRHPGQARPPSRQASPDKGRPHESGRADRRDRPVRQEQPSAGEPGHAAAPEPADYRSASQPPSPQPVEIMPPAASHGQPAQQGRTGQADDPFGAGLT